MDTLEHLLNLTPLNLAQNSDQAAVMQHVDDNMRLAEAQERLLPANEHMSKHLKTPHGTLSMSFPPIYSCLSHPRQ